MKPAIETGTSPVLLAQPHGGTEIPGSILSRLNPYGHARADTDTFPAMLAGEPKGPFRPDWLLGTQ